MTHRFYYQSKINKVLYCKVVLSSEKQKAFLTFYKQQDIHSPKFVVKTYDTDLKKFTIKVMDKDWICIKHEEFSDE